MNIQYQLHIHQQHLFQLVLDIQLPIGLNFDYKHAQGHIFISLKDKLQRGEYLISSARRPT
jgi:hypothetical protein